MSSRTSSGAAPVARGVVPPDLRVAFLISASEVSGSARQLVGTVLGLRSLDVPARVIITQRRGKPVSLLHDHLLGLGVDVVLAEERGPFDPGLIRTVREGLRGFDPTVLETHGYKPHAVGYALRRAGASFAWVGIMHGLTSENTKVRVYHQLGIRALKSADRIVVMSQQQAQLFPTAQDRVRVIFNSVLPVPEDMGSELDLDGLKRPLLGVVGRLSPEKGVDVFLDAAAILVGRNFQFGAALAGEGPEQAALHAKARELSLEDHVSFLGSVSRMNDFYRKIDLLVIPSRSEGLPNVLLEALEADLPIVSTRVGSVPQVLEGTVAGALVEPGSPEELADAIEHLDLQLDRSADRVRILRRFSNEEKVASYLRVYEESMLIRGHRGEGS